jgi:TonB family protein
MVSGLDRLTEREREALRLLARGHDAKSIAADLDLSVHTINERLREVRRKLGVSSSREAARLLLTHESGDAAKFSADKEIGVADSLGDDEPRGRRTATGRIASLGIWGVIMLIAFIFAVATLTSSDGDVPQASAAAQPARPMANPPSLFVEADYPPEAMEKKAQGRTGYRLEISAGPSAKVTRCQITSSSGNAALDAATCRVLISRSRFQGASDAAGRPIAGEFAGRIDWVIR